MSNTIIAFILIAIAVGCLIAAIGWTFERLTRQDNPFVKTLRAGKSREEAGRVWRI